MASVITLAFEGWKAQEAATGKPVLLNEFVFANIPNLDPTKPIDRNEKLPPANQIVHRQAVNKAGLVSENAVAYSVTLGADVGDFDFNWIGLLNKESGTIAMITHAPIQKKLKTQNGQQGNVLIRSFLLEFNGAAEETQIKTSAETWQIDFTARLMGTDEMQRLINVDNYGAAAFFNDGFEVTRSGEQFTVKKGLGYVGGLRGQMEQNQILNGLRNTKIYADFSYQGNIVSKWNTVIKITSAATLSNYVDTAGFTHQVFAIASIDASGNITDLRPSGALIDQSLSALEKQIKLDLIKKIDKENISDILGNETYKVPSLHLLTIEIGKLQPKGAYAPAGYSYSKEESDNSYQPKGEYAPAGNYASSDYFAQIATYSMMESPNHKYRLVIHDDGRVSVHDNTSGGAAILGFSQAGEMTVGSVPASRVTGLVVNELGQSTTQVISQRVATSSFALSEFFGSGFADSWMRTPNKKNFIQILDDGNTNIVSSGNYSFTISPQGEITNGSINATRVTGLFSKYTNVKSQRSHGTTYKNPDNKPLFVIIGLDNGNGSIDVYVNNEQIYTSGNTSDGISRMSVFFIVPPRGEYRTVSGIGFNTWSECA